jgi:DNA topoisomerase-1
VYQEDTDDSKADDSDHILPAMNEGDIVSLMTLHAEQHFTEPPPRYSEASLVKALEEYGIGRPSTYASIISTLQDREYVEMDARRFIPTDIGKIVNRFLTDFFSRYVDYGFTAAMEDELDAVSRGEEEWTSPLEKFWKPFIDQVESIEKNVTREQVAQARELGKDPATGKPVTVRMGRFGPFVQIGTKDDEEKPRFAGLRPGQKMDSLTLPDAMELFKLPRTLGETAGGETVITNVGRFGPYVKYGSKYVSLKEDDPYTVTLERALEVIRLKQEADANRTINDFGVDGIQVLNGRYGPYVTDGKKNAKIPKDRDPKTLTLEECRVLIEQAPARGSGRFGRGKRAGGGKQSGATPRAGDTQPAESASARASSNGGTPAKGKRTAKGKQAVNGNGSIASKAAATNGGTASNGRASDAAARRATKAAGGEKSATSKRPRPAGSAPAKRAAPMKSATSGKTPVGKPAAPVKGGKSPASRPRGEK